MITKLQVKNFRSLRDMTLTLGPRTVLVGPNMSGKSNILDVFKFLTQMVVPEAGYHGVSNAFIKRSGFPEVAWKGADTRQMSIAIEGNFEGGVGPDELVTLGDPDSWRYEIGFVATVSGAVSVASERLNYGIGDRRVDLITSDGDTRILRNLDGRPLTHYGGGERAALEFEVPDWDGDRVRSAMRSWRFYRLVPALMRGVSPSAAANVLAEHGENLSSWLLTLQTRHRDSFDALVRAVKDVFPSITDVFAWMTEQSTVFLASREQHLQRPIPVWQMSDGQLAFISFLSLVFAPEELGSPLYCVEEPENHLHPRLMETLFSLFKQRQENLGANKSAQVILTTHSPHVIDQFDLEEIVVVEKREGMTVCSRPGAKKHLREILAREETGLGQLFFSGSLSSG